MSLNAGYATLGVIPSVKGMRAELEKQTKGDFAAVGSKRGRELGEAAGQSAGRSFKSSFGSVAKSIAAPIAAGVAGAGLFEFFKGAIDGASDLAETTSKVRVIFGGASKDVEKFATDSKRNILLTNQAAQDAAATFGVFGKSAGLTGGELAGFSTKLVGLASDLSSFANTTTDQAIEAIGAALRGEAEPIRAYGVLLDDASLRQEAFAQGLIKTTKNALTPQQRVLSAYSLILKQTKDAQGDAARTQDGFANSSRKLQKEISELQTQLGQKLLPALTEGVHFLSNDALPAFAATGGVVADATRAFDSLPGPVKAATAALVAFRAAQALGVGAGIGSAIGSTSSAMDSLRLRTMLAADSYRSLRAGQLTITNGSGQFVSGVGRMAATLGALKTGATGAGAGLRAGLSGAVALVGGPWGLAFAAGTAALTAFYQSQQKAKAFVNELTESLDEQTGSITEQTRKGVINKLYDEKVLQNAKEFGVTVRDATDAALGNADALARVRAALDDYVAGFQGDIGAERRAADSADSFFGRIKDGNEALSDARGKWKLLAEAEGDSASSTQKADSATGAATGTMKKYTSAVDEAKSAVQDLLNKENQRRNAALDSRRDAVALQASLAAAREEAGKGKDTLDIATEAGRNNVNALLDLAAQWNDTSEKIKGSKGAYEQFRQQFVNIAIAMGASKAKAQEMASQLLEIPKNTPAKVTTPGMDQALSDLRALNEQLRLARLGARVNIQSQQSKNRSEFADRTGTTAPRATASGSRVTNNTTNVRIDRLVTSDANSFLEAQRQRNRQAALDGVGR